MALRLLEIAVPPEGKERVAAELQKYEYVGAWQLEASHLGAVFHVVLPAEKTEPLMDDIEALSGEFPSLRMVLVPVEASLPHVESQPDLPPPKRPTIGIGAGWRVGREELYEDSVDEASLSAVYCMLIALSAVVASVGLLKDDIAVVIGAMVIAPLYGPNAALAVGTSLGDAKLIGGALKALCVGLGITIAVSTVVGVLRPVDSELSSIASRTVVGYADVVLALSAGAAGAFAFTAGRARALTGVVVAVALLPPVAAAGLLLGDGQPHLAIGSLLLAAVNLICINLAAVSAFALQGVQPRAWWKAERARRASRVAGAIWLTLLVMLVVILSLILRVDT